MSCEDTTTTTEMEDILTLEEVMTEEDMMTTETSMTEEDTEEVVQKN